MTERNGDTQSEKPVFAAELFPHRSLGRKGFKVMLALAGVVCLFYGGLFMEKGAWPIGIFFGFDFLLLYGAFWLNYRSGRVREEVTVSRTDVSVRKFSPSGRMVEHRFNPFWARFQVLRRKGVGIWSMRIQGEGRKTEIGSFLNPEDRESFAKAFTGALATVKRRI
ncbi:DUF2244 domain-containing protein [Rhizobium tubonense]|jgi:uncharacterized membrane protein|uniref:DUF2244 domain-containing protein n=1 Tax=Rhizobium tubonense TaxID=484088 RepID=A0A2W4C5W8_9HYPH|nr:DUF2244 domain-containing protein [Rhizobium tubonense]PZM08451.1 hypothetical protein CPY51_28710 [Rhizobium tubonense]